MYKDIPPKSQAHTKSVVWCLCSFHTLSPESIGQFQLYILYPCIKMILILEQRASLPFEGELDLVNKGRGQGKR